MQFIVDEPIKTELVILRAAAKDREWNSLQATLTRIFADMSTTAALEIVINQLRAYLPTFEGYHADAPVVRGLLVTVMSYGFAPERLPEHLTTEFDTPGSGQFAQAVLEMCRAMQQDRDPSERPQLLTSAVANVFLAELSELWYRHRPDAYARVRDNHIDPDTGEYSDPEAVNVIPMQFWIDDEVAKRDQTLWLKLAYAIERKVRRVVET